MNTQQINDAAGSLLHAMDSGQPIGPLRETYPGMTGEDAYGIQALCSAKRIEEGHRVVGRKIGLTATAVQRQLGVEQPDFGTLFDFMSYGDSEVIPWRALQQPKVEAEIGFVLGRDLVMENPSHQEVLQAVDYVVPALEVVSSRIAHWNIKFVDTVADNASSGVYVLGSTPMSPRGLDLGLAGMCLTRRGEPVSTGAGAACLGHPLNAVVWLARIMVRLGTPLRAGQLVLSGALGPMAGVSPGDVFECQIHGVGTVRTEFEPQESRAGAEA